MNYFKKQPWVKVHGILTVKFFQHWTARREKVLFDGVVSYLIPSGITIFLPFSPSTSRTNGKSDSKLLTVNRRVTKEVIRRYKKQSWNYTQAWRKKTFVPENYSPKPSDTQHYSSTDSTRERRYTKLDIVLHKTTGWRGDLTRRTWRFREKNESLNLIKIVVNSPAINCLR